MLGTCNKIFREWCTKFFGYTYLRKYLCLRIWQWINCSICTWSNTWNIWCASFLIYDNRGEVLFRGMYSSGYNNPTTNAQSCPCRVYSDKDIWYPNVDNSLYLYEKSFRYYYPPTQYFDFGGMWGTGGGFTWHEDVFGPRIKIWDTLMNPYTEQHLVLLDTHPNRY